MGRKFWILSGALVPTVAAVTWWASAPSGPVTVTLSTEERHQTVRGWGATPDVVLTEIPASLRSLVLELAVDELGLNRLRLEPGSAWEAENDDADALHLDGTALDTSRVDVLAREVIAPFRSRVEARGDRFELYVSPSFFDRGGSGRAPTWLYESPGEYAEYAASLLLRLRDEHGLEADHYCVCNEPGNGNVFEPEVLGRLIPAVGRRIEELGLRTRIVFPEAINPKSARRYVRALRDRPDVWRHVGLVTWHLYGDKRAEDRASLRDFARELGVPTGQTEFMKGRLEDIFDDLDQGDASYWEYLGLAYYGEGRGRGDYFKLGYDGLRVFRSEQYWRFRQLMAYVRPGAVRISCRPDGGGVRAVAFDQAGRHVVCLIAPPGAGGARAVELEGLAPGRYGLALVRGTEPVRELPPVEVAADGRLAVELPSYGVLTVYGRSAANLPPLLTTCAARPHRLREAGGTVRLVAAATDGDGPELTWSWSVAEAPADATVQIENEDRPEARAVGLDVGGVYRFVVEVDDGEHSRRRQVACRVQLENRPPIVRETTNRRPVRPTLPIAETLLRVEAWDPDGDEVSFAWRIVSHPPGAAPAMESPTELSNPVRGLTAPGEYVFEVAVADGSLTTSREHRVHVWPANRPPGPVRLRHSGVGPDGSVELTAEVADPDGDRPSLWWRLLAAPPGAEPRFEHPSAARTRAVGLSVPGIYAFELSAVDRTGVARERIEIELR